MTISPQLRIALLALLFVALAGAAGTFLLAKHGSGSSTVTLQPVVPAHRTAARPATAHTTPARTTDRPHVVAASTPGLPAELRRALANGRVVVAVVYLPGTGTDAAVLTEARAGAKQAHVPFVALNVAREGTADAVATALHVKTDPSVLVIRRPGQVAIRLDGYSDRQTVAQAATEIRR